jgi:hypothetical protein
MMFWKILAFIVSRPRVFQWLLARAKRTPYLPIKSKDGSVVYMDRWWLFNPYQNGATEDTRRWKWLPSIRIHHIKVRDLDRHMHNHPWKKCRSIVLDGWYEERYIRPRHIQGQRCTYHLAGDTFEMDHNHFHRISEVSYGGVYTMFFTWGVGQDWGFMMEDGTVMPWREYVEKFEKVAS